MNLLRAGLLLVSLGAAGCYDMERLDEGSAAPSLLRVDDFEDGDLWPELPNFGTWRVFPIKLTEGASADYRRVEDGFDGGHALVGDYVFAPTAGDYTGASLGIQAPRKPLDVRPYRALYVTARFIRGNSNLPTSAKFYADLNCDSAPPLVEGTRPLYVTDSMEDVDSDWQQFRLANFGELQSEGRKIAGAPESCLAVVDAIRFTLSMTVDSDRTVSGHLYIDDVYFE